MSHPNEARNFRCPECGEDLTNRWPVLTCEDGCHAEFTVDDQGVWQREEGGLMYVDLSGSKIDLSGSKIVPWWSVLWCKLAHRRRILAETDEGVTVRFCTRCSLVVSVASATRKEHDEEGR